MKKEEKLVNKVKRLIRRANIPRYLHRFGPKTYEFCEHLQALLTKAYCKLSYARVKHLFDLLGIRCPSKSALHYTMQRISSALWNKLLELTSSSKHYLLALDSTGFTRVNPSYHYLRRINGALPKVPVKLSCSFDTSKKKFCSAKISVLPKHDIKDAKHLLQRTNARIVVADKAYDANWLHRYCLDRGIKTCIPVRSFNGTHYRNTLRKRLAKKIKLRTYHRRELIESGFFGLKQKYGNSVSSRSARMIRAELNSRLVCYNYLLKFEI